MELEESSIKASPLAISVVDINQSSLKGIPMMYAGRGHCTLDLHTYIYKIVRIQFYARFLFFISTRSLYREPKTFIQK